MGPQSPGGGKGDSYLALESVISIVDNEYQMQMMSESSGSYLINSSH